MEAATRPTPPPPEPSLVSTHKRLRRDKHQRSDRQRRAKTRETLEQLRALVLPDAATKVEQAHIIAAAVEAIRSMKAELAAMRGSQSIAAAAASPLQALVVETHSQLVSSASVKEQRPTSPLLDLANAAREKQEQEEIKSALVVRAQPLPEGKEEMSAAGWSFAKLKAEQERIRELRIEKQRIESELLSREASVQTLKSQVKEDIERAMRMLDD